MRGARAVIGSSSARECNFSSHLLRLMGHPMLLPLPPEAFQKYFSDPSKAGASLSKIHPDFARFCAEKASEKTCSESAC